MTTQSEKAQDFQRLHQGPCFILPNPWDAGSARLLAAQGFAALATSSAGSAFARGLPDFAMGFAGAMAHLGEICAATDLPVNADLENGFGDSPQQVARAILAAAAQGAVGGSIEDATGRAEAPIYGLDEAVARIAAAAVAARSLPFKFMLTARAENYLYGRADLDDTLRRLQAYQAAGADVLYAPGIRRAEDIAVLAGALERPLNVLTGIPGFALDMAQLAALGVRRVSLGGSLARTAYGALQRACREMREAGTFTFVDSALPSGEINGLFASYVGRPQQ
jgi:2-methylisocitrate lyase-like PEP mutase family enzyme